jgi:hypothetical protein
MKLENIILSEVNQLQRAKCHMFFLICEIKAQYKYKQYYEKQIMLRGGRGRVKEGS